MMRGNRAAALLVDRAVGRRRRLLVTDEKSPIYRYAKRAYFIVDRNGVVKYVKVQDNPLDRLNPEEILAALKASGA